MGPGELAGTNALVTDLRRVTERLSHTFDIFEGTEQIQQLVISRALSGRRIE